MAGEDKYMSGPFAAGGSAIYIGSSAGLPYVVKGVQESGINIEQLDSPIDRGSRDSALQEFSPDEAPCTEYSLW